MRSLDLCILWGFFLSWSLAFPLSRGVLIIKSWICTSCGLIITPRTPSNFACKQTYIILLFCVQDQGFQQHQKHIPAAPSLWHNTCNTVSTVLSLQCYRCIIFMQCCSHRCVRFIRMLTQNDRAHGWVESPHCAPVSDTWARHPSTSSWLFLPQGTEMMWPLKKSIFALWRTYRLKSMSKATDLMWSELGESTLQSKWSVVLEKCS